MQNRCDGRKNQVAERKLREKVSVAGLSFPFFQVHGVLENVDRNDERDVQENLDVHHSSRMDSIKVVKLDLEEVFVRLTWQEQFEPFGDESCPKQ